jgi:chromosome partitioning protein
MADELRGDERGGDEAPGAKETTVSPAIVAVYNQKGGAGKSVSTANLARALASDPIGRRVLVLELDKQGNCSLMLGVDPSEYENPMTGVFEGKPLNECVVVVEERLHLVPADPQLPDVVNSLYSMRRREEVLARQLRGELDGYEIVLIDMPPGQDLLAVNGLVLATHVVVPVRMTDANAVNGLVDLQDFLGQLAALDWERPIALVLRIDCKAFTNNFRALNEAVLEMGLNVSANMTPHTTLVEQSVTTGQTIVSWQPNSAPALGYVRFARELDALLCTPVAV